MGDVVVASAAVSLCGSGSHLVNVTVSGNMTLLEVDGQLGESEASEAKDLDLASPYGTFIGGLPGVLYCWHHSTIFPTCSQHVIPPQIT